MHLDAIKRVRLPAPRRLSPELEKALESRMNRTGLKYMPQVFENGWYCACGSFHPKEEDTVYCTECGCDRILLQNALNTLLQPGQKAAPAEQAPAAEATRVVSAAPQEEPTRIVASAPVQAEPTRVIPTGPPGRACRCSDQLCTAGGTHPCSGSRAYPGAGCRHPRGVPRQRCSGCG